MKKILGVISFENGCGSRVMSQFSWSAKYESRNFEKEIVSADRSYEDNQKIIKNYILEMHR